MRNLEIAKIFRNVADLLEIKGEDPFKVRAYQKATQVLETLPQDIEIIYKKGELEKIPGIGRGIAEKISEVLTTGNLQYYEKLKESVPFGLVDFLSIQEIGPKTAHLLYENLGITTLGQLREHAQNRKLRNLFGLGEKTEKNILKGLDFLERTKGRLLLSVALLVVEEVIKSLKHLTKVERISPAGSIRRGKETVGDIDILVASSQPQELMDVFTALPQVKEILIKGRTKSSIITEENVQVDVRVVTQESFGAALHYFTGSKAHNIKIREMALKKGLKISEYGVFRGEQRIGGGEEKEIFQMVGLPFIPPELRENRGEIKAAQEGKLPQLVELSEIRGDLHVHTNWSDGASSIMEMAKAAKFRGYEYLAICDHSQSLRVANGLEEERLLRQIEEIKKLNKELKDFRILSGSEVNIGNDGRLDYAEEILEKLDVVIGAIHTGFQQNRATLTRRMIKAMENKYVNIIAHPTGRILQKRDPYQIDIEKIIEVAAKTNTFLEINAYPERLDLDDVHARMAKEKGVTISIGTDAHHLTQLEAVNFGVAVARRAWLEKKNILNTLPLLELLPKLKEKSGKD